MVKQTKQTVNTAATDLQTLFDPKGFQDAFMTWANANERMMSVAVEAGTRATDVSSEMAKEFYANVRELTQVRDEPAEYGKAYTDFVQKQAELFTRTAQSYGEMAQKAGSEATDLASKAGEEITNKVTANVESATQSVSAAANKAA